jgi:hypothetical protein
MVMTQSVALFLIAGLFDRSWISCLAVVAEREPLEHRASGHSSPVSLWHRAHLPARPLRSRVCCLRRMVYRALDTLGVAGGSHHAGPLGFGRWPHLPFRHSYHHVLAPVAGQFCKKHCAVLQDKAA